MPDESAEQNISEQILELLFEILWIYTCKDAIRENTINTLGSLKYFNEQVGQSFNLELCRNSKLWYKQVIFLRIHSYFGQLFFTGTHLKQPLISSNLNEGKELKEGSYKI